MTHHRLVVRTALSFLMLLCGAGHSLDALAQGSENGRTFGTTSEVVHVVAAADFSPFISSQEWGIQVFSDPAIGWAYRYRGAFYAGLHLPAGAVVTALTIPGCDYDDTAALSFQLWRVRAVPHGGAEAIVVGSTGDTAQPGCGVFSATPSSPLVIDNNAATYWLQVNASNSPGVAFESIRVTYRLQVSPAPATATFGDVPPSHPFFQFVEALVESGITAGCGGGNYCPDAPLTRGQMAVFLSKGLGLHFAP